MDYDFLVKAEELTLRYVTPPGARRLSFEQADLSYAQWQESAKVKLAELLCVEVPAPCAVTELRRTSHQGVEIKALVMRVSKDLTLPAYLLRSMSRPSVDHAVLALHGHGQVEESLGVPGVRDDYHHAFALALARAGYLVLCPELRGFGALYDLAAQRPGESLSYWRWGRPMPNTLVSDGFQNGRTLIGDTIEDLLRWEQWITANLDVSQVHVAGISWGGDLALTYPVFSDRVRSIFASGTLGSFTPIFSRSGNAAAHCIPGILKWLDRADIAGLNAPRPLAIHYGELDIPRPDNLSAAFNESAAGALDELRRIYESAGAIDAVSVYISEGIGHEMDINVLLEFLATSRET